MVKCLNNNIGGTYGAAYIILKIILSYYSQPQIVCLIVSIQQANLQEPLPSPFLKL